MCLQLLSPPGSDSTNFLYRGDEIAKGDETKVHLHLLFKNTSKHVHSSLTVTCTVREDATLTQDARDTLIQSFPSMDFIPR